MATNSDRLDTVREGDTLVVIASDTGRWCFAGGPAFPVTRRPHDGAVFWRTDLDAHYSWDAALSAWVLVSAGSGAPTDAEYVVAALNASLSAERLLTNTATLTWDFATAGQVKGNVVPASSNDSDARFLALAAL